MTTPAASTTPINKLTPGRTGGSPDAHPLPLAPSLLVLSLSDSFSSTWSTLAAECGLALRIVTEPDRLDESAAAAVIAAGGAEERLESAFRAIGDSRIDIAAVGSLQSHRLASSVMSAGAAAYFALPGDHDLLRSWLCDHAARHRVALADAERTQYRFDGILGDSTALQATLEKVARIIPHASVTVLLTGETGTGKELVARAIHYNGPRRDAPFVDVNCAAIPDQLLESELFGHEKGAFTGASISKPGLFELADGGTLLLDEVGHLPMTLQGKLLRALEERAIRRVGGTQLIPVDLRVVAATHVDLAAAVRRGDFREDLYHRLNVVPIALPPLRVRREDIPGLARHFLARVAEQYGIPQPTLSADAERALAAREWTGNVRELRNLMERTLLLSPKPSLVADDFTEDADLRPNRSGLLPFPATLHEITRAAATAMLELCGGNKSDAARRLGISRSRLHRILGSVADADSTFDNDGESDHE